MEGGRPLTANAPSPFPWEGQQYRERASPFSKRKFGSTIIAHKNTFNSSESIN
ncbi:hypothetical protein AMTRI_Chr08g204050 [Amborella trichopoda]